jgi:hypothetical protein
MLTWAKATSFELYFVAYRDPEAPIDLRIAAAAEMKRRNRERKIILE